MSTLKRRLFSGDGHADWCQKNSSVTRVFFFTRSRRSWEGKNNEAVDVSRSSSLAAAKYASVCIRMKSRYNRRLTDFFVSLVNMTFFVFFPRSVSPTDVL